VARICFQVEEAQWFYEDFIRPLDPSLPSMTLRSFCLRIFQHCPLLSAFSHDNHMQAFEEFLLYKTRVPVRGAIMLNHAMDSVVLVKGWKKGANWSFPRGKINKDEDDLDCAIREVYEETGFDIKEAGLVPLPDEVKYIEMTMREQHMRLYVFRDVPMNTHFEPRTRKEISKIEWYKLSELPAFRKKGQQPADGAEAAVNANKFYMVAPFLVPLKKWVVQQKKKDAERQSTAQYLTPGYAEDVPTEEELFSTRGEGSNQHKFPEAELNTMEGATAALQRLLKIQPPTQGLQPEIISRDQTPVTKSSGEALLALLQGKARAPPPAPAPLAEPEVPHTPLVLTYNNGPLQPHNPHHRHNIMAPLPHAPSPPAFNLQRQNAPPAFANQMPPNLYQHTQYLLQQQKAQMQQYQAQQQFERMRSLRQLPPQPPRHQVQLQHPQPLPPTVQQTVFNGGQHHASALSPQITEQAAQRFSQAPPAPMQQAHFPTVHAPAVPPAPKLNPPTLTSHSLALLNAFKRQDQANSGAAAPNLSSLPGFVPPQLAPQKIAPKPPQPIQTQPQELSTDRPQYPGQMPSSLPRPSTIESSPEALVNAKPLHSEEHRSSLLNIFKSPTSIAPIPAVRQPHNPPTNISPQAAFNRPAPQISLRHVEPPQVIKKETANGRSERLSHPFGAKMPFRPVSILARPPQTEATPSPRPSGPASPGRDGTYDGDSSSSHDLPVFKRADSNQSAASQPPRPFQPQILKRPKQADMPVELSATSPTLPSPPVMQASIARNVAQPLQKDAQKQALLSLFGKVPAAPAPPAPISDPVNALLATLNRVQSRSIQSGASSSSEQPIRRSSHTPISPEDKGFLLSYLDTLTKGNRR
jgi:mRNA-decapping enzyme subunit 2